MCQLRLVFYLIYNSQFQAAKSWWSNFIFHANHLHQLDTANVGPVLPLLLLHVQFITLPLWHQSYITYLVKKKNILQSYLIVPIYPLWPCLKYITSSPICGKYGDFLGIDSASQAEGWYGFGISAYFLGSKLYFLFLQYSLSKLYKRTLNPLKCQIHHLYLLGPGLGSSSSSSSELAGWLVAALALFLAVLWGGVRLLSPQSEYSVLSPLLSPLASCI